MEELLQILQKRAVEEAAKKQVHPSKSKKKQKRRQEAEKEANQQAASRHQDPYARTARSRTRYTMK